MRVILGRANYELLVLVGDTYQIEAIEFGNWFDSVCELTKPDRSDSAALLRLWSNVRKMKDDIFELLKTYSYSTDLDATIFTPAAENEIVLCLNERE